MQAIQSGLETYAQAHAVALPAGMRERVLGNVLAQIQQAAPAAQPAPAVALSSSLRADVDAVARQHKESGNANGHLEIAGNAPASATRSLWAMAASVALVCSLAGNALLYNNWQDARQDLVAVENQQARVAAATQVVQRTLGEVREQNTILRDDQFKAVALAGTPAHPTAHARVLFNPTTKKVFLDVKELPALAAGQQYQLWALDNGKPVDAGMLATATAAGDSLQQMKNIASAQAFAMTVEPVGGSQNPTMSTMTVIGNI